MIYEDKLRKTIARALGYYMYARANGRDGKIQLERYKKLQKVYEERVQNTEKRNPCAIL